MLYVGSERRQKPPSSLNSCLRHRLVAFQSPYAQSLFRTLSLNIPETFCQLLCSINPNSVAFLAIITSIIISITIYHLHSSISFFSQSFDIFACLKMGRIFIMTTTKIKMKVLGDWPLFLKGRYRNFFFLASLQRCSYSTSGLRYISLYR